MNHSKIVTCSRMGYELALRNVKKRQRTLRRYLPFVRLPCHHHPLPPPSSSIVSVVNPRADTVFRCLTDQDRPLTIITCDMAVPAACELSEAAEGIIRG